MSQMYQGEKVASLEANGFSNGLSTANRGVTGIGLWLAPAAVARSRCICLSFFGFNLPNCSIVFTSPVYITRLRKERVRFI